jgi:hypothetical protein
MEMIQKDRPSLICDFVHASGLCARVQRQSKSQCDPGLEAEVRGALQRCAIRDGNSSLHQTFLSAIGLLLCGASCELDARCEGWM